MVCSTSGVPDIAPVAVLKESPEGRAGWTPHEVGVPPVVVAVMVVMVW